MSRLYIRVMTGFYTHKKTVRLRIKLGSDAFWIPPRLWAYAAENQPDGDLSSYTSEELAELIGCPKYATSMLQALKDSGFVEESGMIHDWGEHNGYHEKFSARAKKAADARWAKERSPTPSKEETGKRKEESGDKHCTSNAPSIKRKNPSLEDVKLCCAKTGLPESDAIYFWNKCEANGWTNGGRPIKSWTHTIAAWKAAGYMPSQKNQKQTKIQVGGHF